MSDTPSAQEKFSPEQSSSFSQLEEALETGRFMLLLFMLLTFKLELVLRVEKGTEIDEFEFRSPTETESPEIAEGKQGSPGD